MIGVTELNIYNQGPGVYLVNHPSTGFSKGLNEIIITGKQVLLKETSFSLQSEILDYWDTRLELIVPPVIYPWNNISTFKVQYLCDEFPRKDFLLESALISYVNLTQEIDGIIVSIYVLDQFNIGTIWGWSDIGNGEYEIWFNTSIVSVFNQSVVYVTPCLDSSSRNPIISLFHFRFNRRGG